MGFSQFAFVNCADAQIQTRIAKSEHVLIIKKLFFFGRCNNCPEYETLGFYQDQANRQKVIVMRG